MFRARIMHFELNDSEENQLEKSDENKLFL